MIEKTIKYKRYHKKIIFCLTLLSAVVSIVFSSNIAYAGFNLSVSPVSGGTSIRFGRVDLETTTNKEVRIRINTTENKQYQVTHRISEPFRNERGENLDFDAIVAVSLNGSNGSGTLELQNVERLSYADQLIYTSSNNGVSDSFTMIYQVNPQEIKSAGNFNGQIMFTVRPIGGGAAQENVVLNAFLEVGDNYQVQTEASSGMDFIRLSSETQTYAQGYFKIAYEGNRGEDIKVYQEIVQYPVNELNQDIDSDTVAVWATGGDNGELSMTAKSFLDRRRTLVYSSDAVSDEFWINFQLSKEKEGLQEAGRFVGRIDYVLESSTINKKYPVDIEVEVLPVFEIKVDYPPGGMSFTKLLPNSDPQYKEVIVSVNSNLGKPYWISQNMNAFLTNKSGKQIEPKNFTVKQEILNKGPGRVENDDFKKMKEGDTALYYSDNNGSPVEFKVIYRLRPYIGIQAGDYKTSIIYTLGEI